jgi:hypothetical protein
MRRLLHGCCGKGIGNFGEQEEREKVKGSEMVLPFCISFNRKSSM